MASSNLEIVERGFDAFNESGIEGIVPLIHSDFEGLDFGQDAAMVWELRDGQAIRLSLYPTLDQALSALEQESSS